MSARFEGARVVNGAFQPLLRLAGVPPAKAGIESETMLSTI